MHRLDRKCNTGDIYHGFAMSRKMSSAADFYADFLQTGIFAIPNDSAGFLMRPVGTIFTARWENYWESARHASTIIRKVRVRICGCYLLRPQEYYFRNHFLRLNHSFFSFFQSRSMMLLFQMEDCNFLST